MQCDHETFSVEKLTNAWQSSNLRVNSEYQRGAKWKPAQRQALVDSLFRGYPIPPLFLHAREGEGLGGMSKYFEIVDGQQRILALSGFLRDEFALLPVDDRRLRLPHSLRKTDAPWANLTFSKLHSSLQEEYLNRKLNVYIISNVNSSDEIRDLFIRLQAGTALSRQQKRDAWPGNLGPYIEGLAGKIAGKSRKSPREKLFKLVDRRGMGSEDEYDEFEIDRQLCAQMLCLYLSLQKDFVTPRSIGANDLDHLYHENTEFDPKGPAASRFEEILAHIRNVLERTIRHFEVSDKRGRKKFAKFDVFSLLYLFAQLVNEKTTYVSDATYGRISEYLASDRKAMAQGRTTSGNAIKTYYEQFRDGLRNGGIPGVDLDPQRAFSEAQKQEMKVRQQNLCPICQGPLDANAEGDHHPTPHHLGGRTDISNGRLVHRACHLRGKNARPKRGANIDDEAMERLVAEYQAKKDGNGGAS